jgi:hypothetical protein
LILCGIPIDSFSRAAQQKVNGSGHEFNMAVFFSGDVRNEIIIRAQPLSATKLNDWKV